MFIKAGTSTSLGNTRKLRQLCTCMLLSIWNLGKRFEVVFDKDIVTKTGRYLVILGVPSAQEFYLVYS